TIKENDLTIHVTEKLPQYPNLPFMAKVDVERRNAITANHSATHLLHKALRDVLGTHVEQKGSFVCADYLRFDFSHYQKLTDEEIVKVEKEVNRMIRENIKKIEYRDLPIKDALAKGAMALFGEKYGDKVRMIVFGDSIELCGGTHAESTGNIGLLKIVSEGAVAAGIRRIEAVTAEKAFEYLSGFVATVQTVKNTLKAQDCIKGVENLLEQNNSLKKEIEKLNKEKMGTLKKELLQKIETVNGISVLAQVADIDSALIKDFAFELKQEPDKSFAIILGTNKDNKAALCVVLSDDLVAAGLHAGNIIREAAKEINGGGGGQAYFATAGGKKPERIKEAVAIARDLIKIN
ncbi:MAG: DHHA1 domain-containing protein, partial [Bacteroidales bacterium]|nr:DHHA1 domain-containing protein [Bacteroidales bacterium]